MEDHNLNLLSKLGTFYPGKHGRTLQFLYTLHTTLSCHMAVHRASSRVPPGRNIASARIGSAFAGLVLRIGRRLLATSGHLAQLRASALRFRRETRGNRRGRPGGRVTRHRVEIGTKSCIECISIYIYIAMGSEKTTVSPTVFKRLMCTHTTWVAPRVVLTCSKRVLC